MFSHNKSILISVTEYDSLLPWSEDSEALVRIRHGTVLIWVDHCLELNNLYYHRVTIAIGESQERKSSHVSGADKFLNETRELLRHH